MEDRSPRTGAPSGASAPPGAVVPPGATAVGVALAEREAVLAFLDAAEAAVGAPLVDESERERLAGLTAAEPPGTHVVGERHWSPLVAREGVRLVGYVGILHPFAEGEAGAVGDAALGIGEGPVTVRTRRAVGELAVLRDGGVHGAALAALLGAAAEVALAHDALELEVWLRAAHEEQVLAAVAAGFAVRRRLAVLGRSLGPGPDGPGATVARAAAAAGLTVRAYRGPEDDADVVALLAAAHAGGPDAGWDAATFAARRRAPWFDAADLLLAESTDPEVTGPVGLHWCKRRGSGVGEVHNLVVRPGLQGRGIGAVLLDAGLARLADTGCHEAVLWVDLENERALRLYRAAGFASRWEDIALVRTLVR